MFNLICSRNNYFLRKISKSLNSKYNNFIVIDKKSALKSTIEEKKKDINKIFFLHWNYIVPSSIYNNYECINLHTGNLPEDRGGSPIHNQILLGKNISRVNALRMSDDGIDSGPIYCSEQVSLQGNIFDITNSLTKVGEKLITNILNNDIKPVPQVFNNEIIYKRNKNNTIDFTKSIESIYDKIRILDSDDYPTAYLNIGNYKLEFSRAKFNGEEILSDVKILLNTSN
jgi:methionyl-tRNA formyltransferase